MVAPITLINAIKINLMKIKKLSYEASSKYVIEKHKPIIPTIIYFSDSIGNYKFISFEFSFWKWWFKIGILIVI